MVNANQTGVQFVRPELRAMLTQYDLISDCIAGEVAVKSKRTDYLPDPSPSSCDSTARNERYASYLARAVFYNATRRTLDGLIGQIYSKEPIADLPASLETLRVNASGDGVNLIQQTKEACKLVLAYSRAGLLVDFPQTDGRAISKADLASGSIRPTITLYRADEIVNWRKEDYGAEEVLTLVVLREKIEAIPASDVDFGMVSLVTYRVLRLTPEGVRVEIWKPDGPATIVPNAGTADYISQAYVKASQTIMRGSNGLPLDRIPFEFIGLSRNSIDLESPAFYDLASLNIAHYRNSADYEESAFILGQPTLFVGGLTQEWITEVLGGKIVFGARGGIAGPTGSSAELLQASENTLIKEAMAAKERQMVAIGAKLVQENDVQRTATEARLESSSEGSILQNVARNVSDAYSKALTKAAAFLGETAAIEFHLNDDFDISRMSPEEQAQVMGWYREGIIVWSEAREIARKRGIATLTDEDAKAEKDLAEQESVDREVDTAARMTEANGKLDESTSP